MTPELRIAVLMNDGQANQLLRFNFVENEVWKPFEPRTADVSVNFMKGGRKFLNAYRDV